MTLSLPPLSKPRRAHDTDPGPEWEAIAEEVLTLMPSHERSRYTTTRAMRSQLHSIRPRPRRRCWLISRMFRDRPLAPYLRTFHGGPVQAASLLGEAEKILCSLPAHLRARVCQSLADGVTTPELVRRLTGRWSDEVSEPNKSIASLAYHRSLRQARQEGHIDDDAWQAALTHLGEQASCYGPDHEARRRGAWVGICVCEDWTALDGRVEMIGEPHPVGVPLADLMHGPDRTLLQQIASRWEDLRFEFGDTLLLRLSGIRQQEAKKGGLGCTRFSSAPERHSPTGTRHRNRR